MASHDKEPLPVAVRKRLEKSGSNTHPGLMLDKYVQSYSENLSAGDFSKRVQKPTIEKIVRLSQTPISSDDFEWLVQRHRNVINGLGDGREIKATTTGPMTLHLSRASSLENAGICLHPIYGFVYLPGTGVKGMARAWAETVWLPAQDDSKSAWKELEDVFGWSPNKLRNEQIADGKHPAEERPKNAGGVDQSTGGVIFHDAWPLEWPKLQEDILNSHHPKYYSEKNEKNVPAPGDWESPVPVYFLSVQPKTPFAFALSPRRAACSNNTRLMELAERFLVGALLHNGAGAKTTAGYGAFRIDSSTQKEAVATVWADANTNNRRASFSCEVELVTPAFLAGADPEDPNGCDLRAATLRGHLRAWWRTMHASWLSVSDLRRLESALWGDTNTSGAIRVTVEETETANPSPVAFDRGSLIADKHNDLPRPGNRKTAQGLTYHSYGMDERGGRRFYRPVGCRWTVRLLVRPGWMATGREDEKKKLEKVDAMLHQGLTALWLLLQFGGVGSKSRKGFGSLHTADNLPITSLDVAREAAAAFRNSVDLSISKHDADSPSIDEMQPVVEVSTPWQNHWFAVDRVADAAQEFAQSHKHNLEKKALGLPRNVRQPFKGKFRLGKNSPIQGGKNERHASPLIYKFLKDAAGKYVIRFAAFPAAQLPDLQTSQNFLAEAMTAIEANILARIEKDGGKGGRPAAAPPKSGPSGGSSLQIKAGDRVQAVLQEERTRKGGWRAKIEEFKEPGPITNSADVSEDAQPGQTVKLVVAMFNGKQIAFRWPTTADAAREERAKKNKSKKGRNRRR